MAGPALLTTTTPMVSVPDGWQLHAYWHNLDLELHVRQLGLAAACVCLALLLGGRALLPASDRSRVRLALLFVLTYLMLLFAKAGLLAAGQDATYATIHLISLIALYWAIIGVFGLFFFDIVGRRFGVPKILRDLVVTVLSFVILVTLLSRSGVNFLGIVATSAVVTAVVGLALQDTLGNLISGIALQVESTFSIGDWIRVDEKPIGRVREIRWRSTVIQTKNGDLVTIPNGLFSKGVITQFNKDGLENRRWVYFNVHLRHAPNFVIATVVDALAGAPNVSTVTPPDCIVWEFTDSFMRYAVRYRLVDYLPDDPTDSEVRKRIWYALQRQNIEIPFTSSNVYVTTMTEERAQATAEEERTRRHDLVAQVPLFAPLSDVERQKLAASMRHATFGKGETVMRHGEPGQSLYVVRAGTVSVRLFADGMEREVATLGPGDFFGEMSLMTGEPRNATVVAATDVECYIIESPAMQQLLHDNKGLTAQIGRLLSQREMKNKIEREGMSAEAASKHVDHDRLLERIKSFFGLA
jgi:small-conductance mechanosensitive channel/CRP-like cAMP-binding protein